MQPSEPTSKSLAARLPTAEVRDYFLLLKPGVSTLVLFTAAAGLLAAPGSIHVFAAIASLLAIALGSGSAGAINMWLDRDIDAIMLRTRNRPLPAGRVDPTQALVFGTMLAVFSIVLLWMASNWLSAVLLAFAIGFYVFVYTLWLKRRTAQNIVIGGAAGAFPPVIGWSAVTGDISLEPLILFLIIFLWTPPHFWSLALHRCKDYQHANIPMLPVVAGKKATRLSILIYSLMMALVCPLPSIVGEAGGLYMVSASVLGGLFFLFAWQLWRHDSARNALRLFKFSIFQLFALFAALIADRAHLFPLFDFSGI